MVKRRAMAQRIRSEPVVQEKGERSAIVEGREGERNRRQMRKMEGRMVNGRDIVVQAARRRHAQSAGAKPPRERVVVAPAICYR